QRLEARDVDRDVVVDEEDRAGATRARVGDVVEDAIEREPVKVPPSHLDDRAEAAIERAAARRFDDVDLPAEQGIAGEDARTPPGRAEAVLLDRHNGPRGVATKGRAVAEPESRNRREGGPLLEAAYDLPKRQLALAANDDIHVGIGPDLRSQARGAAARD